MKYFYSVTTLLTYLINRHCYDGKHYTFVAEGFYPYGLPNPKSSNPLLIYMDLYQPWKDDDKYDKFITQHRMGIRKGVLAKKRDGVITPDQARDLKKVGRKAKVEMFYPVVVKIKNDKLDIEGPDRHRASLAGSAHRGSHEYRVTDLYDGESIEANSEFELLMTDYKPIFLLQSLDDPRSTFNNKQDVIDELVRMSP